MQRNFRNTYLLFLPLSDRLSCHHTQTRPWNEKECHQIVWFGWKFGWKTHQLTSELSSKTCCHVFRRESPFFFRLIAILRRVTWQIENDRRAGSGIRLKRAWWGRGEITSRGWWDVLETFCFGRLCDGICGNFDRMIMKRIRIFLSLFTNSCFKTVSFSGLSYCVCVGKQI